jgi:tetratricopeptide (TPR) repeat protein
MLRWGDAVQHYGRALELAPQRADARLGLGNALMKQGEIEKAEAQLRQAVAQRPGDVAARIAHARCLAKAGRAEESQKTLSEIVQASPDHVDALLELGTVELTAGAHAEALQHLQRAARLKPESREVIYAYANALKKNGRIEEANTCLRFVDEATKPLLKLKDLTNQLLREPENVELRLQVALITWRYKSREEGAQWLLSLLKVDPQYPPAHAALAEHYALLGDEPRAVQHRRLAGLLLPGATGPPAGRKTQSP